MDDELLGSGTTDAVTRGRRGVATRQGLRHRRPVAAMVAVLMVAVVCPMIPASTVAAAEGEVVQLPEYFSALALNNSGAVAGSYQPLGSPAQVAVYDDGELTTYGTFDGFFYFKDFNDAGDVLISTTDGTLEVRGPNGTRVLPQPVVDGSERRLFSGFGPADDGAVVGIHGWAFSVKTNAVRFVGGSSTPITELSTVMAVNGLGHMVGMPESTPARLALSVDGAVTDLGFYEPSVRDFTDSGKLLLTGTGGYRIWDQGQVTPISGGFPYDINNDGVVALQADGGGAAIQLVDGTVVQLPEVVEFPDEWQQLYRAEHINDACQVLGSGQVEGVGFRYFLATVPDCEPPPPVTTEIQVQPGPHRIGDQVQVKIRVTNSGDRPVENFALIGGVGLAANPDAWTYVGGPTPSPPATLAGNSATEHTVVVSPADSGNLVLTGGAVGSIDGEPVIAEGTGNLPVLPQVDLEFSTSVTSATKVGDEFDVIATVSNAEDVAVSGVTAGTLAVEPAGLVEAVAGPTNASGNDPRVDPVSVPPGGSVEIRWRYRALDKGDVAFSGGVSATDPYAGSLFFLEGGTAVAIESPGLELSAVRLQPGSPMPGEFGNVRGTVTNVGSVDVTDIDFDLESTPELDVLPIRLSELDPLVSPRIDSLAVGESREFLIPVGLFTDVGDLATYSGDLTMAGTASVDGVDVAVDDISPIGGGLDLTDYWPNLLDQVGKQLRDGFFDFFEGVNDWGDSSTLGGVSVGSTEGVLTAFQKMGDGILTAGELVVTEEGRTRLTETGKAVLQATREYLHTTTPKKMIVDFADVRDDITIGAVGVFADWLYDVDTAAQEGDYRQVSSLLTEPATQVATGVGVEVAAGQLFTKFLASSVGRKGLSYLKRAPDAPNEAPGSTPDYDKVVDGDYADLKDMPTGVPLSGQTVARAGLTLDEHAWMIEMSKEHGVAFFVRPRPQEAAKWARLGYNAKPMPIKFKSVSDIDAEWLGYPDGQQGVVIMREPTDPYPALKNAVESGELNYPSAEIDEVLERYNLRKAEWENFDSVFAELNAQNGGEGFDIQRYGKTIRTKLAIDADGTLRMTWNNKPIFSDIDLLQIGKPNGEAIDPDLHRRITEAGGFGLDGQHGDSAMTSDFPNWKVARKVTEPYVQEHTRGGDPLVIVQPDVTTLGYVDNYSYPDSVPGSGYDLYGKVTVTYEGAAPR